jgi:hypothetical protein
MHPIEHLCCQNSRCPDAGRRGHGNLSFRGYNGKGQRIRMVYCRTCKARFSERKGTVLEQARLPDAKALDVLNHLREGWGPGLPDAWSVWTRTPSHATSPWPGPMPSPSTGNWWPFPPTTREVQFDEKWGFRLPEGEVP